MEKKTYITPAVEITEIETANMLAASIGIGDGEVDAGEAWSNDRRGSWGNLWDDENSYRKVQE